jgi:hypothetical protein
MSWFKDLLNPFGTKHPLDNPGGYLVGKYLLKGQNTAEQRLASVQVNRSSYGLPMPLVYGKTRIPISLLWYGSFKAIPHTQKQSGGKGVGGGGQSTSYTYQTAAVMGLCEGPITGVGNYWVDKEKHSSLSDLSLTLFSGAGGQAVWSFLTTNAPAQAVPYDHSAYLAAGALDLGNSAAMPNLTVEVKALQTNATYNDDAVPSAVLSDYLTDPNHGVGWNFLAAGVTGAGNTYESYCIAMGFFVSPQELQQRQAVDFIRELLQLTNSEAVWSQGALRIVPYADAAVTGNSRTYTPDLTPLYSFNDNDYCPEHGEEPVMVTRTPSARSFNKVRVEIFDRALDYNTNIAEAADDQDIRVNGERPMPTVTMHQITDIAVGRLVAQLILQRQLYIRNIFRFRVRADYSLLEPMDLVSINESSRGIVNQLVRIQQIEDDESDNFTITAEEMLVGTAGAPRYDTQLAAGYAANYNNAPGVVTTPLIIAAPPQLVDVNGGYELWIAVAGSTPAAWGGCDVFASMDNTTFGYVGTIYGPSRYGTLTSSCPAGSDPETANYLTLQLVDPNTQLVAGTQADADNLRTLMYVDGEIVAYRYCTLVGSGLYGLTSTGGAGGSKYMRRGKYGSANASHASGSSFMRIDDSIFRMRYDPGQIGQTMYFKFCSFNIYGRAKESLGAVSSYSKVLSASNAGQSLPGNSTFVARGNCATVGDRFFKSSGSAAWDSDIYSIEAYSSGCIVKFRPGQIDAGLMVGFNSDPLTDQSYTSLDHAWYLYEATPGAAFLYESGSNVAGPFTYAATSVFSISYDGITVRYYIDGVLKREIQDAGKVFFLDSSFLTVAGTVTDVFFGALNSSPSARLIARGNCVVIGNTIQKVGGASAWDSDCYSAESFATGCAVSWRTPASGVFDFFIGLNTDPTTDQSYTSLDYSIEAYLSSGVPKLAIYESNVQKAAGLSAAFGDVLAIKYDGHWIRYYVNGALLREVFDPGKTFYMDSSFYNPGAIALDVNFGPLTSATPSPFLARGNCKVSDANVIKQGGSSAWDSDCYSIVGYPVAHVSFKANDTTSNLMVGLNQDPTADQSYTSIDYAWYCNTGSAVIYESGSPAATIGSYTTSTVFSITYDGTTFRYYFDGVLVRSVTAASNPVFLDSSFFTPGCGINSLRFGPTTNLKVNDTPEIGSGAITDTLTSTSASTAISQVQFTPDSLTHNDTICSISYTPPFDCEIQITATGTLNYAADGAGGGLYFHDFRYSIQDGTFDNAKRQEYFHKGSASDLSSVAPLSVTWRFAGTAGVAVTYKFLAAKFYSGDTATVTNAQMILTAKKR